MSAVNRSIRTATRSLRLPSQTEVVVEAPLGHRLRREEAKPEILKKYQRHLAPHFSENKVKQLVELGLDQQKLESTPVDEYVDLYVTKDSKFI
ncbi:2-methylcitrate dehydratase like protein [Verticillium longisporum]|nr:2-methylcitrate dehydratase like protein [Verticillium longisporum]